MTSFYVSELDQKLNTKNLEPISALKKIAKHIQKKVDPTFPEKEFIEWADSDSEKPFRHNAKRYFWDK